MAAEREAAPTSLKAPDDAVRGISIPEMPTDALAAATESAEAAPGTDAASAQTAPPPEPTPETTEQKRARRRRMVAQSWKVSLRRAARQTSATRVAQAPEDGPGDGKASAPASPIPDSESGRAPAAARVEQPVAPAEISTHLHSQPVAQAGKTRAVDPPVPAEAVPPPTDQTEQAVDATHSEILLDQEAIGSAAEAPSEPAGAAMPDAEGPLDPVPDLGRPDAEQEPAASDAVPDGEESRGQATALLQTAPALFVETGLKIGVDERPLPAIKKRRRSRRGGEFLLGATSALVAVVIYLAANQDGNFVQHTLAVVTGKITALAQAPRVNSASVTERLGDSSTSSAAALAPTVAPDAEAPNAGAPNAGAAGAGAANAGADAREMLPPPAADRLLSSEEVRYCVFQRRRLGYLRSRVEGEDSVQRFNSLVGDFNSRCSHFRFENKALQDAFALAEARRDQLKADAEKILASWPTSEAVALIDVQTHEGALAVQSKLKALGYYQHNVDGVWGPRSVAALADFRKRSALGYDGTWDRATQSALLGQ